LGTRIILTLEAIDLKFDTGDYVGGVTPQDKNGKNWPLSACERKGRNIMFKRGTSVSSARHSIMWRGRLRACVRT